MSFRGLSRLVLLVAFLAVLAVGAANVPGAVGDKVADALSSLNPFSEKTVDRSGPSVLHSLTILSDYHAVSGHYETVVDIKRDHGFLPGWVAGDGVLYVGKGDVDAVVDFGQLDERRIALSQDRRSVTVRLPAPTIGKPVLNLKTSYVAYRDEGFVTRFRGSDLEHEAQLKAVKKMTTTATGEGMLIDLAKKNTTTMMRGLLGSLGYTSVKVTFDK